MKKLFCIFLCSLSLLSKAQERTPLNESINTEKVEYAASISADGNTLVFQSNRDGRYKLYVSSKSASGTWESPEAIESVSAFGKENDLIGGPSISYDGNLIYFFATFEQGIGNEDLWYIQKKGTGWSDPINLGAQVNTKEYEGFPSVSPDGKKLYFMRFAPKQKYESKFCYRIYVTEIDETGVWQAAKPIPKPINGGCEKCPRIMSDNETLIYSAVRGEPSKKVNYDFYQSRYLGDNRWSRPVALGFINSPRDDVFGSVPSSGEIIYLNVLDGKENQDIYTVPIPQNFRPKTVINVFGTTSDASTQKPIEASLIIVKDGDTVNTGGLKSNAFDGNYTVVLTEGHQYELIAVAPGYGHKSMKFDLKELDGYRKERKDFLLDAYEATMGYEFLNATTKEVVSPTFRVNSVPIKSAEGNYSFTLEYGKQYVISAEHEAYESYSDTIQLEGLQFRNKLEKTILLKPSKPILELIVMDQETQKPIESSLMLYDNKRKKMMFRGILNEGKYLGDLDFDRQFLYRVTAENYFYQQGVIELTGVMEGKNVKEYIELAPLKVGSKLVLNNINFEFGSSELTAGSKTELNNVITILAKHREIIVQIAAHTDDVGSHSNNMKLSEERAHSVRDYLLSKGIQEDQLTYIGYGETKPMVANISDENRAKNRRVEFIIKGIR